MGRRTNTLVAFVGIVFALLLLTSVANAAPSVRHEDWDGDGKADHTFHDTDGDGKWDYIIVDMDEDGNAEETWHDRVPNDGIPDVVLYDDNDDGKMDRGKFDNNQNGKFDKNWVDADGSGSMDCATETTAINPEETPVPPTSGSHPVVSPQHNYTDRAKGFGCPLPGTSDVGLLGLVVLLLVTGGLRLARVSDRLHVRTGG